MGSPIWQKSSYSGSSNACIEVRATSRTVELRESEDGDVVLRTDSAAFADLLRAVKAGELDHHA
ncbi:DUF397 domain-containing protein [Kitasatospora sp. NPDC057692]|uniref:DUF397 domain-containing protein n=1 Tax=Kitasatospora sp. NPDC057692 TaxID=3346215 RepID=UPI0036AD8F67